MNFVRGIALQRNVGVLGIVARAHGGIAIDPIAGGKMCGIGSARAHLSYPDEVFSRERKYLPALKLVIYTPV